MNGKRKYRFPVSYPNQQTTIRENFCKLHGISKKLILVERQVKLHEELPIKTLKKFLSVEEYSIIIKTTKI
jgi:hypothetical protein